MRKKMIHVLNWEKYQARSDKELPWCKLWGGLFKRPWFVNLQDDEKFATIAILDMARQFGNNLTEEMLFKRNLSGNYPYLKQIYGLFMSEERLFNLCKSLSHNGFLSDSVVGLEGEKTRQDKSQSDRLTQKEQKNPVSFDLFYEIYPKKIARGAAEKVWERLKPDEALLGLILSGVEKAKKSDAWKKENGRYIPHPATWLNQKRWLDQHETEKKGYDIWQTKPIQIPS